ncbi:dual adapter for phosphotyrosine and 3-phosphotyrosine and 3-phosphoinositide-like isoform X2 [Hydractinia symbiolongicarpus]|uniref:dual adapter for phosphotyrosine and 3-phosphotyrosine and 3-phosphoinositide-like isoform X2 n=1 Tax=Hydractinia symbiolongicarpus TaxID=13093 RepID=UPI00254FAE75|nr:dual adapter for phosphotyrosine and 3-phosphotyrosine and 3-phosphoinositide-like isoform X2 [Hydractinia symbiolongicarpus]
MARGNAEVEELDWFHPNLNRHHAEALLIQNGKDGSYLLRTSTSHDGEYSLSCRCADSVKHFQIGWDGVYYTFGMGTFNSLAEFVKHFENKPLIGGESGVLTILKFPYPRDIEEPDKYETVRVHAEWKDRPTSMNDDVCQPASINSKEGYLTKQGGRFKSWKARWFVLCKNELKYYKTKGDKVPIRTLDLNKCTTIEEDFNTGKEHTIRIEMPDRHFFVFAATQSEKQEWLDILQWKMNQKVSNNK